MTESSLRELLAAVQRGEAEIEAAIARLRELPFEDAGVALIDHHRELRQGAPEVIFGEGKSAEQIAVIAGRLVAKQRNVFVTRLGPEKLAALAAVCPDGSYEPLGRTFTRLARPPERPSAGRAVVICAGTSDLPVMREATQSLIFPAFAGQIPYGNTLR